MVYRFSRRQGYIGVVRSTETQQKGKTMASQENTHDIWDFPVRLFNKLREKIARIMADRASADERWLNG